MATSKTITFTNNVGAVNLAEREVIQEAADQIMEAVDVTVDAEVADLGGVGRTTETIKGNADNVEDLTEALGFGTFATGTITFGTSDGELTVTSRIAGTDGNGWTITPITIVGAEGDVTVDEGAKTIEVEVTDTTTTDDQMATYINEDYLANKIVKVVSGSAGAVDVDEVITMAGATDGDAYVVDENSLLTSARFTAAGKPEALYGATQLLSDGANIINERDVHLPVHGEHIIKHPLMAVATYDFAVHGGVKDTPIPLTDNVIPDNAIITKVIYDVVTDIASTSDTGTIKFSLPTNGDLTVALTASAGDEVGLYQGIPGSFAINDGDDAATMAPKMATNYIRTTAARAIQAEIATNNLTAGKINVYVWYVGTERV